MSALETLLEVRPGSAAAAEVVGWARWGGTADPERVEFRAGIGADGTIAWLEAGSDRIDLAVLSELVGAPAASGLRRRLTEITDRTPGSTLIHRLLDDLPILTRLAHQAQLIEHPAVVVPAPSMDRPVPTRPEDVPGADQCEGWRSDGTMVQRILDGKGRLTMALGAPVQPGVAGWSDQPPPPPMATRRRRRMELAGADAQGRTAVTAYFRDSYSDPDGVERGLHSYQVQAEVAADGTVADIGATGLILPWPECWAAAQSAGGLVDVPVARADTVARTELTGLGTCTHLTDMLRTLADVPRLQTMGG